MFWRRREVGSVIEREIDHRPIGPPEFVRQVKSYMRYEWQPPFQLTGRDLPKLKLAMDCYVNDAGVRRFTVIEPSAAELRQDPLLERVSSVRKLAFMASCGGHLLLRDRGEVDSDALFNPDEARIFLQYIQGRRESLHPRKNLAGSLGVPVVGRPDKSLKTILPDDFGVNSSREGERWSIATLMEEGFAAAQENKVKKPTPTQVLSFGLRAAAAKNPLYVESEREAHAIMRMFLFSASGSDERVTEEQLQLVTTHVRSELSKRWHSNEALDRWIKDPKASVLRSISKSLCPMPREHVKKVLLELGWRSLQSVGKHIDVQMRTFRDALTHPLTEIEEMYFREVFLSNPAFGGLPLILLRAHCDVLEAAILGVWCQPGDRDAMAILHRAMTYYADMLNNRRTADSNYKRRSAGRTKSSGIPTEVDYPVEQCSDSSVDDASDDSPPRTKHPKPNTELTVSSPNLEKELLLDIVTKLARNRGLECDCSIHEWDAECDFSNNTNIRVDLYCPALSFKETFSVPRSEFEEAAREIQREDDDE